MKKIALRLLLGFNLMSILLLWGVAACQYVPPSFSSWCGVMCMLFPAFVLVNLLFIPLWLITHTRYTVVPIVGLLCCYGSLMSYCPMFNGSGGLPDSGLKVITYNTLYWGNNANENDTNLVIKWCIGQQPDILLGQEVKSSKQYAEQWERSGYRLLRPEGMVGTEAVVTRLPVIDYKELRIPSTACNSAVLAHLQWGSDTIAVFSVHLESFHLNTTDRDNYVNVVRNPTDDGSKELSQALVDKLRPRLAQHGEQADTLLLYVQSEMAAGHHVILGGDFNDVPNSYAAARFRSHLTDCFRTAGNGIGFTFNESMMYFRIDHLFSSSSLQPVKTWVDKSVGYSDHYPIVSVFRAEK